MIRTRAARAADCDAVLALVPRLRAFGPGPLRPPEAMDAGEIRTLEKFFDSPLPGTSLWVAEDATGRVIGAAFVEEARDYFTRETHGHLGIVMVDEAAEGMGVGRALLACAEQWSTGRNHRFLTLNVFPENERAIAIYERAGYRPDAVKYVKVLQFADLPGPD